MSTSLRHPRIHVLVVLAMILVLAPAARAASMLAPLDIRPKDFAFIKENGVYHLFYIRHNDLLPAWATETDFGHAVSTDLYHWTQLPPVLGLDPYGWDNLHVWAPHVVKSGGLFWMFYTGVTEAPGRFTDTQRIGVAVSNDLMTWNRILAQPAWENRGAPWAWWAPLNPSMACRDPFVMEDPNAPGQYLLYYTTTPAADTTTTLVGVARSSDGDLSQWVDEKPLWITHRSVSANPMTESPHLFEHDGRWFMFITTGSSQPLTFYVGSNPLGEPAEWTYRGRLRTMLGFDTSLWFASESLRDGEHDLFAFCAGSRIEIRRIVWGVGDNFSLTEPAFFHAVAMEWSRPSVREFEPVGLRLVTANWYAFDRRLEAFVRDGAGAETPAPLDSIRLSATPDLTGDSTMVPWFPRRWPSTLAANQPMQVRVALDDGTASTPWLTVSANPHAATGSRAHPDTVTDSWPDEFEPEEGPGDTLAGVVRTAEAISVADRNGIALRALARSPLGTGPAVAFELPEPAAVRADVFDLQGRRVATLANRHLAAGAQVLPWDGRDATGSRARRGLYFVRVMTTAGTASTRLLLDR